MKVRSFMEDLWQIYKPYADTDFPQKIQEDFDARFWEMYLTCALLENSIPVIVKPHKRGPDILIESGTSRIWIEAIAPSSGAENSPDQVPNFEPGVVTRVPEEEIILRLRSAISEKFDNKYFKYLENGVISPSDAYIIAINSCKIPAAIVDSEPPRIIKAVYPAGYTQITIDVKSRDIVDTSLQYRPSVKKASGEEISTDLFLNPEYENLSGILYSRVSVRNLKEHMGEDFIFVHNRLANNKVPQGFFKLGKEYTAEKNGDRYTFTHKTWS